MLIRYGGGWVLNEKRMKESFIKPNRISLITKLAGLSTKHYPAKNIFTTHGQRYEKKANLLEETRLETY